MSLARAINRGAALKARLGVNGIQYDSRSLGTAIAAPAGNEGMATPLPLRDAAASTLHVAARDWHVANRAGPARDPRLANVTDNGRQSRENQQAQSAPAARLRRPRCGRDRSDPAHDRGDPRGLRTLRLRAG